jgi:agmatinase
MLQSDHGNCATERGAELGLDFHLDDLGDVDIREDAGDDARIRAAIAAAPERPIVLGGDHSISFPVVQSLAERYGPLEILHFDAHPDLYDSLNGDRRSHASPFARIMEARAASRLVQIGIRTLNRHNREQAKRFGVEIIEARCFGRVPAPQLRGPLYISIDLDAFDPAYAPGVSHHEPGGLTVRDVVDTLLGLRVPIVGADVVELNPERDLNGVTAVLAAKLVKELAAALADNPAPMSRVGN